MINQTQTDFELLTTKISEYEEKINENKCVYINIIHPKIQ